jgi:hypothetical protein
MRNVSYSTPDEAVRIALENLDHMLADELDDETLAAIEQSEAQIDSGQVRSLEEVRAEFRAKSTCK